ncbi:MAG: peptidoglycan-binding protein [Candidatus Improbicoccus devescovinae]|nr:MAG: peptidoglycan-binding protein [Candidatus Improbicoccus devescovinae]
MAIGRLRVNVLSNDQSHPIPESVVRINQTGDNNIIFEAVTDESGKTDTFELEAPPVDYSLEPETPKPYSEYDVTVENENYEKITIKGVQILADVTSQQNVLLNLSSSASQSVVFEIQEHVLYGDYPEKIAEEEIKPLPSPTGFVVLDSPIIPEFIIVHDGVPDNANAANYWVPYKDYIKNVCSSEIYPTWPKECIRANALAIISFTLNRVYTEWYRSKGYGFTITSSTAYDQKFIYQRNIYEDISVIIDEIFSTYVTKANIDQPLFTQYCDGQKVTCPGWLSQWGSKYLADNGASHLDILKNYYSYDIYLELAKEVAGVPSSYPGEVLQNGSSGSAVRTIQQQLNDISNNFPAIHKIAIDGIYGPNTENAVKIFQSVFDLPETGIVDYATWYEISKIYVAVKKLS